MKSLVKLHQLHHAIQLQVLHCQRLMQPRPNYQRTQQWTLLLQNQPKSKSNRKWSAHQHRQHLTSRSIRSANTQCASTKFQIRFQIKHCSSAFIDKLMIQILESTFKHQNHKCMRNIPFCHWTSTSTKANYHSSLCGYASPASQTWIQIWTAFSSAIRRFLRFSLIWMSIRKALANHFITWLT